MSRHLRPVPDTADEPVYVIARSSHVRPGTPYVIALCVDRAVAAVFALAGQLVRTRDDMGRDASLREALRAWEAGDQSMFHRERAARAAIGRNRDGGNLGELPWHPSRAHLAQP